MPELTRLDLARVVRRLPKDVVGQLRTHPLIVAGGFIRACVSGESCQDVDLFGPSVDVLKMAADAAAARRNTNVHETANAFTVPGKLPVQYIQRWLFDDPADCLLSFDFTIAQAAVWHEHGWRSLVSGAFYEDLAARRLVYTSPQRSEDAGGSMIRVLKFYTRGYRMPLSSLAAVVSRLVRGVHEVSPVITEEQLTFVLTGLLYEVDPAANPEYILKEPT